MNTCTLAPFTLALALLAGCAAAPQPGGTRPRATAALMPTAAVNPNAAIGNAALTALDRGVRIAGEVHGLSPGREHGFHIHERGDCGNNGEAAGGHFNPGGTAHGRHGAPPSHAGDLPSLVADATGRARFAVELQGVSLVEGAPDSVIGRALVVHRDRDDYVTQPNGNSGPRIACAVIRRG